MGYKDDKRQRRGVREHMLYEMPPSNIDDEKTRARELRNTPWWRRKIADGVCNYCGKKFPPSELTMDHVIPLSRGGRSERINIVASCKNCNSKKKYLLPVEWLEYQQNLKNEDESADNKDNS